MYEHFRSIDPTPGLAFEAFVPGSRNPVKPQPMYAMRAAGPAMLSGFGAFYHTPRSRSIVGASGFGEANPIDTLTTLVGATGAEVVKAIGISVAEATLPTYRAEMKSQMTPLYVFLGVLAVGVATSATYSYLCYKKHGI